MNKENEYNIDLFKLLNGNVFPDEKVVYVAKLHWIIIIYTFFILLLAFVFIVEDKSFTILSIFLIVLCIFNFYLYLTAKIILTNKHYIISSPLRIKNVLLDEIIQVEGIEYFLNSGKLYLRTRKNFNYLLRSVSNIEKIKELEFQIKEQIKLNKAYKKDDNEISEGSDIQVKKTIANKGLIIVIFAYIILETFLIYKGLSDLSKILTIFFATYLFYRNFKKVK